MADTKRNDVAGKVVTPKTGGGAPGAQAIGDLFEALGKAIGARYVRSRMDAFRPERIMADSGYTTASSSQRQHLTPRHTRARYTLPVLS